MSRIQLALLAALASGCTFNVASVSGEVRADGDASYAALAIDVTRGGAALEHASVEVRGTSSDRTTATARIIGLRTLDRDPEELLAAWALELGAGEPLALRVLPPGPDHTATFLERLDVTMPRARDVVLTLGTSSASLTELTGRVTAEATSGSVVCDTTGVVEIRATSGSIEARAAAGTLEATSGSIHVLLDGWVSASATSGSIAGRIGDGGMVSTTSGSVALTLDAAPTRDLVVSATSGSVVLRVPTGVGLELDLAAGSGSVHARFASFEGGGHELTETILGGGPTIHVRTESGSITVEDGTAEE